MTLRLLVADESVATQKMIRLAYATEDAEIEAVFSGDAALDILYEFRPDVVLAAVSLSGYNGYEVCELIRQDPEFAATPVILIAGAFDTFDDEEAARVEASGHLTKPFDTSEMTGMIERLCPQAAPAALLAPEAERQGEGDSGVTPDAPRPDSGLPDAESEESAENPENTAANTEDAETASASVNEPESSPAPPPVSQEWDFSVSPRSWESFLGAHSVLEIFGATLDDQTASAAWPIPKKLVNRVADETVARLLPQLETFIEQALKK